ncbi:MAG: DUF1501 domain-containing protein [Planctomycetes bacterium]|jgi:uncharacterized protein (DUF1501 family)|nr:DUF1501 domain-containing protein [Planctomycetota bacterium]
MTHEPTRRTFLQASALAGASALAAPITAAERSPLRQHRGPGNKVTVVLFQRGGADHLNVYAPVGDANYAALRPTIGIAPPGSPTGVVGLPMNATFAMHPAMAGLHAAFVAPGSRVGVVQAVGYQPGDRSHFVSQDLYETALQTMTTGDGWINRHLQVTSSPTGAPVRALALRGSLPRAMFGAQPCYAVASTQELLFGGAADTRLYLEAITGSTATLGMPAPQQLAYQSGRDTFALLDLFQGIDPLNYVPANGAVYPTGALGRSLREIAELVKAGLGIEFFAVDQGGWDHHTNLVVSIAPLVQELSAAITAFLTDLGPLAADVVLVTMSEFGRTAAQNGSGGTDHGAGGAMLVCGGAVNGGTVHGSWPGLAPGALQDGRYLAASNDYRDVLREVLVQHMGGTDPAVVFPGRVYQPIGVL